jgi:hypothetical protein
MRPHHLSVSTGANRIDRAEQRASPHATRPGLDPCIARSATIRICAGSGSPGQSTTVSQDKGGIAVLSPSIRIKRHSRQKYKWCMMRRGEDYKGGKTHLLFTSRPRRSQPGDTVSNPRWSEFTRLVRAGGWEYTASGRWVHKTNLARGRLERPRRPSRTPSCGLFSIFFFF